MDSRNQSFGGFGRLVFFHSIHRLKSDVAVVSSRRSVFPVTSTGIEFP